MNHPRVTRIRTVGGAAAMALLLTGGLGVASSAAFAQETEKVERKIIKKIDKDGNVTTLSDVDFTDLERKCGGEKVESKVDSESGGQRHSTRVVICSKDGKLEKSALNDRLAAALEKARDGLGRDQDMSAERRAEVLAKLQAEIERVRSAK